MPDQNSNSDPSQTTRRRKRVWSILIGITLLGIGTGFFWTVASRWDTRSADERLAEIEAARAIPASENAAMIYNELFQDPKATSLSNACSRTGEPLLSDRVLYRPWLSKNQPEVDAWIKEYQYIIDRLLAAARFEKCRFPISIDIADTAQIGRGGVMRQWAFLLSSAANNDIAEGRIDAALAKWRCLIQMGNHLYQQPLRTDQLVAMAVGKLALESMALFIMIPDPEETHLQEIEAMPLPLAGDDPAEQLKAIHLIEDLTMRKLLEPLTVWGRLRFRFDSYRMKSMIRDAMNGKGMDFDLDKGWSDLHFRGIATARGIRILVALKRYKNATGRWPASLNEIRSSLPAEVLIDPFNGGAFVYQPTADTFRLYSRGKNNIDENGKWDPDAGPDDWPIWPPRRGNPEPEPQDANGV